MNILLQDFTLPLSAQWARKENSELHRVKINNLVDVWITNYKVNYGHNNELNMEIVTVNYATTQNFPRS